MAKAKGSATPGWKAAEKMQDSQTEYIERVHKYSPKAMDILCHHIDNPTEHVNLSFSAAKKMIEERNRLYKELKNKKPKDYIPQPSTTVSQWAGKSRKVAEEEAGIPGIGLKLTYDPADEDVVNS